MGCHKHFVRTKPNIGTNEPIKIHLDFVPLPSIECNWVVGSCRARSAHLAMNEIGEINFIMSISSNPPGGSTFHCFPTEFTLEESGIIFEQQQNGGTEGGYTDMLQARCMALTYITLKKHPNWRKAKRMNFTEDNLDADTNNKIEALLDERFCAIGCANNANNGSSSAHCTCFLLGSIMAMLLLYFCASQDFAFFKETHRQLVETNGYYEEGIKQPVAMFCQRSIILGKTAPLENEYQPPADDHDENPSDDGPYENRILDIKMDDIRAMVRRNNFVIHEPNLSMVYTFNLGKIDPPGLLWKRKIFVLPENDLGNYHAFLYAVAYKNQRTQDNLNSKIRMKLLGYAPFVKIDNEIAPTMQTADDKRNAQVKVSFDVSNEISPPFFYMDPLAHLFRLANGQTSDDCQFKINQAKLLLKQFTDQILASGEEQLKRMVSEADFLNIKLTSGQKLFEIGPNGLQEDQPVNQIQKELENLLYSKENVSAITIKNTVTMFEIIGKIRNLNVSAQSFLDGMQHITMEKAIEEF
ncbi:hypothetical protein niasHT_029233 [Heterodera trifolii]|uniref:Pterin-binding domain-containing protein n=1 Tax=Heterodera trifolii TaxID=157864 RepID=A0ABD2JEF7_9BILA